MSQLPKVMKFNVKAAEAADIVTDSIATTGGNKSGNCGVGLP